MRCSAALRHCARARALAPSHRGAESGRIFVVFISNMSARKECPMVPPSLARLCHNFVTDLVIVK
jgi:hypothetical protein